MLVYDGLEIVMMNVGNADCFLTIRHYPNGATETVLIDGGNKTNAAEIAKHLADLRISHINHVVNTHPHDDHASGLIQLLSADAFSFDHLWLHQAWNHIDWQGIRSQLGASHANRVLARFNQTLSTQYELYDLSIKKGVTPTEPFSGSQIGPFTVLGPTREFYLSCLQYFGDADKVKKWNEYLDSKATASLSTFLSELLDEDETTLGGITSPENESSVVLATTIGDRKVLFAGDAGCDAFASMGQGVYGQWLSNLDWMQAPHHGSRRNLWETAVAILKPKTVFISAEGSQKHPSRKLVNTFNQIGAKVFSSHYPSSESVPWILHPVGNVPNRNLKPATALYEAD